MWQAAQKEEMEEVSRVIFPSYDDLSGAGQEEVGWGFRHLI